MAENPCLGVGDQFELFGETDLTDAEMLRRLDEGIRQKQLQKRNVKMQALKWGKQHQNMLQAMEGATNRGRVATNYIQSVFAPDSRGRYAKNNLAVELESEAIKRESYAPLAEGIERYRLPFKDRLMLRSANPQDNRAIAEAVINRQSNDPNAMDFAQRWHAVSESLRRQFNAAGGDIRKRDNWNLPQAHDIAKTYRAGYEQWWSDTKPLLDIEEMGLTETELDRASKSVFDNISTGGLSSMVPGSLPPGATASLAKRYREHRFLQFKNADAWLDYAGKYGNSTSILETMTNHIERMSQEISLMRALGPTPEITFRRMMDVARKEKASGRGLKHSDNLWRELAGKMAANGEARAAAGANQAIRNWQTVAKLPGAMLSALGDVVFDPITKAYNGANLTRAIAHSFHNLNPSSKADRIRATQWGNSADYALQHASAANRFSEITGFGFTTKMADLTMRMSFLNVWTISRKRLFELEWRRDMANQPSNWNELSVAQKSALDRYGITPEEWPTLRAAQSDLGDGDMIIDPMLIEDTELRRKALGMYFNESRYAVPEPGARVRSVLTQGLQRGTLPGETFRHISQFKSFPVTVILNHWQRGMLTGGKRTRLQYMAGLIVGTTLLGTISYQSKRIATGKEPLPFDNRLLAAGFMQGGGGGIFADFLFSNKNRFGHNMFNTVAGPFGTDLNKYLYTYLFGAVREGTKGDIDKMMDILRRVPGAAVQDFTPGKLWYIKLLFQRAILDEFNKMMDPKWEERMRKYEKRMRKAEGAGYWSRPGEGLGGVIGGP